MIYEDKNNKVSVVVTNKAINIYNVIIPINLAKDFKTTKEDVLLYHTEAKKVIKIRKQPDEKRIKKEIKKFIKENNGISRKS